MEQTEARYERNPDFIFRKIMDELVLVPVHQDVADLDCIYTMNPVGAFIWEHVNGDATLRDIHTAIVDNFAADPVAVADDLIEFLDELQAAGAVRRVSE